MENPKCPYCGGEMKPNTGTGHNIHGNKTVWFTYCCDVCEAESPPCDSRAEARAAAMKREREKGEWIWEENEWQYRCSACRMTFDYDKTYELFDRGYLLASFCPNCGADMRKEATE